MVTMHRLSSYGHTNIPTYLPTYLPTNPNREFSRLQRNLMDLLQEQKSELDSLREKGLELETATATTAAAATATAMKVCTFGCMYVCMYVCLDVCGIEYQQKYNHS